jgi:pimeloyl-ACP methyl ester carboxylesterase
VLRSIATGLSLLLAAVVTEHVIEVLDTSRLTRDQTFCSVHDRRVRYRLGGSGEPGPTIVLISGWAASIEQWQEIQDRVAQTSPVLSYDRGGLGFSDPSDVHDPEGLARGLGDLLRALHLPPPYVVVSYSSSALMARLFVAQNEDDVRGVVLLDPLLPKAQRPVTRVLMSVWLKSLIGLTRLRMHDWSHAPTTPREERERAILASFHHWNAAAAEGMNLDVDWSPRLMAAPAFRPIPVGVVCSFDETVDGHPEVAVADTRRLAAESPRGYFVATPHVKHGDLLVDATSFPVIIDTIHKVEAEARASPPNEP